MADFSQRQVNQKEEDYYPEGLFEFKDEGSVQMEMSLKNGNTSHRINQGMMRNDSKYSTHVVRNPKKITVETGE